MILKNGSFSFESLSEFLQTDHVRRKSQEAHARDLLGVIDDSGEALSGWFSLVGAKV